MVPLKVIIEGFLCYRARQEVDLGDMRLCMLAGPNGSGKSTVFDAITFALFGSHRGGSKNLDDLINKRCDTARVTFEFAVDGAAWQVYRTIKRGVRGPRATGEARRPSTKGDGGEWDVVPDTSSEKGLSAWVASKLALSGKAFTRSMLLWQGESDRLLSSEPRERFEVLAGVAELERYQALERSANERRRKAEGEAKSWQMQLEAAPPVEDAELERAAADAVAAAARVKAADESIHGLQGLHVRAQQWADLKAKLDDAVRKHDAARGLIGDAARIEAAHRRLASLAAALPHLSDVFDRRGRIERSKKRVGELSAKRDEQQRVLAAAEGKAKAARDECAALDKRIPELEALAATLSQRLGEMRRTLDAADATEKQRASLARVEAELVKLTKKHAHPETALKHARDEAGRLAELSAALPTLTRFAEARRDLAAAVARRAEADGSKAALAAEAEAVGVQRKDAQRDLKAAEDAAREAREKSIEVQTDLKRSKDALAALDDADGRPDCPTCGQPLSESRLSEERRRREADVARQTERRATATKASQACEALVKQSGDVETKLERRQAELEKRTAETSAAGVQSGRDIARATRDCGIAYAALPEALRAGVAPAPAEDWTTTAWPSADEVAALERESGNRALADRRVVELDGVCASWRRLTSDAAALRDALAAHPVTVPDDVAALRGEFAKATSEAEDATKRLKELREQLRQQQRAQKERADEAVRINQEIAKLTLDSEVELATQSGNDEAIREGMERLCDEWPARAASGFTARELDGWRAEADELDRGARASFGRLVEARQGLSAVEARVNEIEADIAAISEPARRPPEALAGELERARADRARQDEARRQAESRHATMHGARRRRQELECSARESSQRLRHLEVLSELLGKKRLQRHLVRRTERRVVECANHILEKLSGGDLLLQLREGGAEGDAAAGDEASEDALDLVAVNRSTGGGRPIAVAFLSGSQRFRVAVSLALAIGQVAGDRSCGECVIIDEGFGSLDAAGQDVMIAELRRLQGIMKRIVLVSHQESFADAFPDGYRFAIHDGETRVERMSS